MPVAPKHKHRCPVCSQEYPRGFCRSSQACGGRDGTPWPNPCRDCETVLPFIFADFIDWSGLNPDKGFDFDWFVSQLQVVPSVTTPRTTAQHYYSGWIAGVQRRDDVESGEPIHVSTLGRFIKVEIERLRNAGRFVSLRAEAEDGTQIDIARIQYRVTFAESAGRAVLRLEFECLERTAPLLTEIAVGLADLK